MSGVPPVVSKAPFAWLAPRLAMTLAAGSLTAMHLLVRDKTFVSLYGVVRTVPYVSEAGDGGLQQVIFFLGMLATTVLLYQSVPWLRRMHAYQLLLLQARVALQASEADVASQRALANVCGRLPPVAFVFLIGVTVFNGPFNIAASVPHYACAFVFFLLMISWIAAMIKLRGALHHTPRDLRGCVIIAALHVSWISLTGIFWSYAFDLSGSLSAVFEHLLAASIGLAFCLVVGDLYQYDHRLLLRAQLPVQLPLTAPVAASPQRSFSKFARPVRSWLNSPRPCSAAAAAAASADALPLLPPPVASVV